MSIETSQSWFILEWDIFKDFIMRRDISVAESTYLASLGFAALFVGGFGIYLIPTAMLLLAEPAYISEEAGVLVLWGIALLIAKVLIFTSHDPAKIDRIARLNRIVEKPVKGDFHGL